MRYVTLRVMNGHAWREAREAAGKSLRDADYEVRSKLDPRDEITTSKLSRFERDEPNVDMSPAALGVLASLYGVELRELDPDVADDLERLRDLVLVLVGPGDANGTTRRERRSRALPLDQDERREDSQVKAA